MLTLDWLALSLYFVLILIVGVQTVRRVKSSSDFAVASNRIIWPVMFATLAASFLGGGASLGRAGESFVNGYAFMFAASAFPIQTIFVGYFIAPRLKRYAGAQTVGDVMAEHYGSMARLLTGLISIVFCAAILGAQALAIGTIASIALGISVTTGILVGMGFVLVYSTVGGMWAVVQTDILQFLMLGVFLPVTLIIGITHVGGPAELVSQIPSGHFSVFGNYTLLGFLTVFLSFGLGEALVPPYAQRAYSSPDAANARKGYTSAGLFGLLFYFVTASLGLVALVLFPDIQSDAALPTLVKNILPIGLTGLVLAALLAVVMSTADSYLNSTAVVFVKDLYLPFVDSNISERGRLWMERGVTLIVGVAAIVFALYVPSIVDALLYSYALWAPTIIIPLVLAVVWGFRGRAAAVGALLAGLTVTAIWTWILGEPFGVTGLIAGLVANVSAFFAAYLIFNRGSRRVQPPASD